jgi:hypothetical protein
MERSPPFYGLVKWRLGRVKARTGRISSDLILKRLLERIYVGWKSTKK